MRTRQRTDDDAFDERGILRDGHTARITMAMRDSTDQWRGDMSRHLHRDSRDLADRRRRETRKYDPKGRLLSTAEEEEEQDDGLRDAAPRRPHFTDAALDEIERVYQEVELRDANAWRNLEGGIGTIVPPPPPHDRPLGRQGRCRVHDQWSAGAPENGEW
jgi:hypothetical protein